MNRSRFQIAWMKFFFAGLAVMAFLVLLPHSPPAAVSEKGLDVAHCKTLEEINQAKARGAEFLEIRSTYFVRIGNKYDGPFSTLERAIQKRNATMPTIEEATPPSATSETTKSYYFPMSVIFPFTDVTPEKKVSFTAPNSEVVDASRVMIHGEPFSYDTISFGPLRFPNRGAYFAVTGHFNAKPNIQVATESLAFSVGASVVSDDGTVLWHQYGIVEKDLGFRCIAPLDPKPNVHPRYLLVFSLAKGKMEKLLSSFETIPFVDASPFEYHVLCSAILEIGPNWYPPLEEAIKEEYAKLYKEEMDKRAQKAKGFRRP